jgi:glycosyltransferase involved in cell wall biosynthesis
MQTSSQRLGHDESTGANPVTPKISVIIPTRNRSQILAECLSRLLDQTLAREDYEIIVIDDASQDQTPEVIETFAARGVSGLRLDKQSAAASARNAGILKATSPFLLFLDDDAFVARDFIEQHLRTQIAAPGITTGPIVLVQVISPQSARGAETRRGWHRNPFPSGNVSVPRHAVEAAGMFDESFTLYGWEDPELFQRLKSQGLATRFCRKVPIYHYKPECGDNDIVQLVRREQERGRMGALFYAKHPAFGIGWATKRLPAILMLNRLAAKVFCLERRLETLLAGAYRPSSAAMRLLLMAHAEISAGNNQLKLISVGGQSLPAHQVHPERQ